MLDLGSQLKELREEKQKKQIEVAEAINIARNTLSQFENNIAKPSLDVLLALCNYYNCSLDYLVGRDDYSYINFKTNLTNKEKELIENFRLMSDNQQTTLLDFAKFQTKDKLQRKDKNI